MPSFFFLPFLGGVLWNSKVFNFDEVQFIFFLLVSYLGKFCLIQGNKDLCLFSFKTFIVLVLTLGSLVPFE